MARFSFSSPVPLKQKTVNKVREDYFCYLQNTVMSNERVAQIQCAVEANLMTTDKNTTAIVHKHYHTITRQKELMQNV